MDKRVAVVYSESTGGHRSDNKAHDECPARLTAVWTALEEAELIDKCHRVKECVAADAAITGVHDEQYLERISEMVKAPGLNKAVKKSFSSVYMTAESVECAKLAAGCVVEVTKQVVQSSSLRSGMAVVRPPGHHAEPDAAMGFCIFNNVAIAAKHAVTDLGLERVMIVDWDIHHGNGTQHMFETDPRVLYLSLHRWDGGAFFPGGAAGHACEVGHGPGLGKNINIAFWGRTGMYDADYLAAFSEIVVPAAKEFAPQLILVSAGFDAAEGDLIGEYHLTPAGYAHMTRALCECCPKVVVALEGGYNLSALSKCATAVLKTLLGDDPEPLGGPHEPSQIAMDSIARTKGYHAGLWKWAGEQPKRRRDE